LVMPKVTIKDWGKGLNKDQSPWELAPGFWSDGQNVRFRSGKAERVGGIATVLTPTIVPYWMLAQSSGATRYVIYAGTARAYTHDGTTETEITRTVPAKALTAPNPQRVANVVTMNTVSAHGLTTADTITVYLINAAIAGTATDYSATNVAITVTGATSFTYANTGVNNAGVAADYAYVPINTASVTTFTGGADDKPTGGNLNGVAIYNNPVDGLFYWDQAVTGRFRAFPATTYKSDFARPFKDFIFQGAPTISGTKYRHQLTWSDAAEPGTVPSSFVSPTPTLRGSGSTLPMARWSMRGSGAKTSLSTSAMFAIGSLHRRQRCFRSTSSPATTRMTACLLRAA
jgi:hypothetical protein